jgi:hypothetical protein
MVLMANLSRAAVQIQALQAVELPGASAKDFMAAAVRFSRDPAPVLSSCALAAVALGGLWLCYR